ncbi:DNA methyltransferase [Prevotella sp. P2-180]|uniref:class I SAM-dependent DNA methyltransferase n=1 Tax=Prevotella sp. P2-180 TaxID=2024224 RepID=UPI000B95D793|nr:DNA methyltransferase [Prevotella sp. P2-180]OYP61555.1 hypothetical protein CIK98_14505 [Prevotella sp. P2-180]
MAKKTQLGYREIEERLMAFRDYVIPADEVGYELLYSFGKSERDIERYKEGKGILKTFDGLLIKGLLCFCEVPTRRMTTELELLKNDSQVLKAAPKIVAVSDGKSILAYDLREKETYENQLDRLYCDFGFFYPLMGIERIHYVEENPADVKAAEKLAKLHDELRAYNDFRSDSDLHDLNIFITRLLFCFFAEDTGIFEEGLFTTSIMRYTKDDGSDLSDYLDESFNVMDLSLRSRDIPKIVKQFPYVNGGLFSKHIQIPKMGARARKIIIECGELDWKDINPDIFGSMIQAVVNPEERATQGMHYTSVPNIMKVINPLFLDELREKYHNLNERYEKLRQLRELRGIEKKDYFKELKAIVGDGDKLLRRMSQMKFFDPACGSGNFLIITYKSLRFLEMDILKLQKACQGEGGQLLVDNSVIRLDQFYGIELLDFPHEVAMLSLWLAEHQMNRKLNEEFGVNTKALPLKNITQIVCGNACRLDWDVVCPHTKDEEVFVFGNPPYLGFRLQTKEQKKDMENTFANDIPVFRKLDYISQWFYKGAKYVENTFSKCGFVSTNSICQGEHISLLWKYILEMNVDIPFAYTSFKWKNNAKHNAGVTCVIVGLSCKNNEKKMLFSDDKKMEVEHISPLLSSDKTTIIQKSNKSISGLMPIILGSLPADDNNLSLNSEEKRILLNRYPELEKLIKPFIGAKEFIDSVERYCLWIEQQEVDYAYSYPELKARFLKVAESRKKSPKKQTVEKANKPWAFSENRYNSSSSIIIPAVSSEKRKYIPIGFVEPNTVIYHSAFAIYNGDSFTFGIVESHLHMVWVKNVSGKLETRIRYSAQLCYNTFPFPKISASKKEEIANAAEEVLITREFHVGKTLAELYDPDTMPDDLRKAHETLDDIVESCYPGYPFANDEARLECLFKMYEKMTSKKH